MWALLLIYLPLHWILIQICLCLFENCFLWFLCFNSVWVFPHFSPFICLYFFFFFFQPLLLMFRVKIREVSNRLVDVALAMKDLSSAVSSQLGSISNTNSRVNSLESYQDLSTFESTKTWVVFYFLSLSLSLL